MKRWGSFIQLNHVNQFESEAGNRISSFINPQVFYYQVNDGKIWWFGDGFENKNTMESIQMQQVLTEYDFCVCFCK